MFYFWNFIFLNSKCNFLKIWYWLSINWHTTQDQEWWSHDEHDMSIVSGRPRSPCQLLLHHTDHIPSELEMDPGSGSFILLSCSVVSFNSPVSKPQTKYNFLHSNNFHFKCIDDVDAASSRLLFLTLWKSMMMAWLLFYLKVLWSNLS